MELKVIQYTVADGIATVTLTRPHRFDCKGGKPHAGP